MSTRSGLLLHAAHAARDVLYYVFSILTRLRLHCSRSVALEPVQGLQTSGKVSATVGMEVCRALIGLHAYTGCDSVSAFAGNGKTSALKLLTGNRETQDTFLELGQEWDLSPELMDKLEAFTCLMYVSKASTTKINDLTYQLFCAKKEIESHQLPPCKDCLTKHAQRANYQAAIWRRCLEQDPQVPSPIGRGWKMEREEESDQLVVHWMEGQPAPDAVLDLLACNCTKKCHSQNVCVW